MVEIEKIRKHPLFIEQYESLETAEDNRIFCRHQMPHLLDVARIAYIKNLEENLNLNKRVIYAAALLHDIGKAKQYKEGIPHEIAGREIAGEILHDVGLYSETEVGSILQAIEEHRRQKAEMSLLGRLLYESDKQSRACYACAAEAACNWDEQKKNMEINV